jgi:predicted esterase
MLSSAASLLIVLAGLSPAVPQPEVYKIAAHEGGGGRILLVADPMLAAIAGNPDLVPEFTTEAKADENGKVAHALLRSGWAFTTIESEVEQTVLATGRGFHSLFVNGERFAGDFYRYGGLRMPVPLLKGTNRIFVRAIRGEFTLRFVEAEGSCSLSANDSLLPDLREGCLIESPGAVIVLNHEGRPMDDAALEVGDGAVFEHRIIRVPTVLPYGMTKAAFPLRQLRSPKPGELDERGRYRLPVSLKRGTTQHSLMLLMILRQPDEPYRETRISDIDGSVQYHAVRTPVSVEPGRKYALYLSLHGASVEGFNQARAYRDKRDAFIVAPTNRRKFGFDWQDWGRLDALEALDFALARYPIDPDRVYLTGHSMGGHGTWYLGTLYPSLFAAVAPSAGWASFFTYGGGIPRTFGSHPALKPFAETQLENDTLAFVRNLAHTPIYILHGEADDNVPLSEAKRFAAELGKFHHDFTMHVQPGAGHWWGDECVDWPPLFEFCRRHLRVLKPLEFTFRTPNPAISSTYAFATIHCQERPGEASEVTVKVTPRRRRIDITTENVRRLHLWLDGVLPKPNGTIVIDGEEVTFRGAPDLRLEKAIDGHWRSVPPDLGGSSELHPTTRNAALSGPFKQAFNRRMVWVYGTSGTPEENAAILARVRYEVGVWWYRGNGSVAVVADRQFEPARYAGRNVILYGNADTNSAYAKLLPDCPVRVARGIATVGKKTYEGDFGLYLVYLKPDRDGLVGVLGETNAKTTRMAQQSRHFVSGSACPDYAVWSGDVLEMGMEGAAAAGWFDSGWGLTK